PTEQPCLSCHVAAHLSGPHQQWWPSRRWKRQLKPSLSPRVWLGLLTVLQPPALGCSWWPSALRPPRVGHAPRPAPAAGSAALSLPPRLIHPRPCKCLRQPSSPPTRSPARTGSPTND